MSIGSISDALSQVSQIEAQIQQLQNGSLLDSVLGLNSSSSTGTTSATDTTASADSTGSTDSATFADALAQAQGTDTDATSDDATTAADTDFGSLASSDLGSASDAASTLLAANGGTSLSGTDAMLPTSTLATAASVVPTATSALPSSGSSLLTSGQQQFASTLAADTGLNPSVVSAWMLSEESGGAAQSRQAQGNNDWLNIGYTDSQTDGGDDSVWSDPTTAANATAQWLQGQDSVAGYGTASSGIQSILQTVGQSPESQIAAIQDSGWSSSGYPELSSVYSQLTDV